MEMLGANHGGVLVIISKELVLPGTADYFEIPIKSFETYDLQTLLDNPTGRVLAYMVSPEGVREDKIQDIACLIQINLIRLTDRGTAEVSIQGLKRYQIKAFTTTDRRVYATDVKDLEEPNNKPEKVYEMANDIVEDLNTLEDPLSTALSQTLQEMESMSSFADFILYQITEDASDLRRYLNTTSVYTRMKEAHMALLPQKHETTNNNTDKLKSNNKDVQPLIDKYYEIKDTLNDRADKEIFDTLKSLAKLSTNASDYSAFYRFADFAINLPWTETTTDNGIEHVEKAIDKTHYGMKNAKERILEYLAIRKLNPEARGTVILLDGAPGTGKTTLAQEVAKAMGRKCERVSMGGCHDASFIKGHGRTYVGARQGRIMSAMSAAGVKNPVIILDEVEKVSAGNSGDPSATLLELLDPGQNTTFNDNYLGFGFDMSKVLFICTSNNRYEIPAATMDRMEVIELEGYSLLDKMKIATDYVVPKKAKDLGVKGTRLSKAVLKTLIEGYTREAGVRGLEKAIDNLFRKVAIEKSKGKKCKITKKLVENRLGLPYIEDKPFEHNVPGVVSGLYYSTAGGGVLDIEAAVTDYAGNGKLSVTGMAGDVMMESISLVRSYLMANAHKFGIDGTLLNEMDIHLHMPDGSTPKDGPSAGGAYTLLLMSLLVDEPVKPGLCLTGEATLTGRFNPIGGIDQKCAGAVRMGMKEVILPKANYRDYVRLPDAIKKAAKYHFCSTLEEVLKLGFDWDVINGKLDKIKEEMKAEEAMNAEV